MSSMTAALLAALALGGASAQSCPQPLAAGSNLTIYPCGGADPNRFQWNYVPKTSTPWGPRLLQLKNNPSICMAIVGISPLSNTPNVGSAPCDPTSYYQGFYLQLDGSIVSSLDGNVLDVYDQQTTPGTRVDTYSSNGQANQKWSWNATSNLLVSAQSGFCAGLC